MPTRRHFLERSLYAASLLAVGGCSSGPADRSGQAADSAHAAALLDDVERRTFLYFWETTDAGTGLAPDRWPTQPFSNIAAVGFALTAYPIGVERGWITRAQARERVRTTLLFFRDAPQGPEPAGRAGYKGFFYRFLDMRSGTRSSQSELSTIDTALLLAGMLFCQSWFDGAEPAESEIRALVEQIYARVDWRWAQPRAPAICLGWMPESGHLAGDYSGYNEAMLLYLLALGSPSFAVDAAAWGAWTSTYGARWVVDFYGQTYLHYHPLFVHQFTHCWVDFRGVADAWMRVRGLDYFENSRRATLAQRAYAIANPEGWAGYGSDLWGITASDGPADVQREFGGRVRRFISYAGRGIGGAHTYDDGTIAPYGAGASIAFAPEIAVPALQAMHTRFGNHLYGRYGFLDAFNLSFQFTDVALAHGRIVPGVGWFNLEYLGIAQGPLLAMFGNHRGEVVWRATRRNAHLRNGLLRAGMRGGWLG